MTEASIGRIIKFQWRINTLIVRIFALEREMEQRRPSRPVEMIMADAEAAFARVRRLLNAAGQAHLDLGSEILGKVATAQEAMTEMGQLAGVGISDLKLDIYKGGFQVEAEKDRSDRIRYAAKSFFPMVKNHALTLTIRFSRGIYKELKTLMEQIKKAYEKTKLFYRNRPSTVLRKLLSALIKANIRSSFARRSSLAGDLIHPQVTKWPLLNPVYAKLSGRNRRQPGSNALRNELVRRADSMAKTLDKSFGDSRRGDMIYFFKIATKWGRGTKWFWKIYSFYFGSNGVMFGGKVRRARLRGKGPRVAGKTMTPKPRIQPPRPITLITTKDLQMIVAKATQEFGERLDKELKAIATLRWIRTKTDIKITPPGRGLKWTSV